MSKRPKNINQLRLIEKVKGVFSFVMGFATPRDSFSVGAGVRISSAPVLFGLWRW